MSANCCSLSVAVRRRQRHPSRVSDLPVRQPFGPKPKHQGSPFGTKRRSTADAASRLSPVLNALPDSFLDQVPLDLCQSGQEPYDQWSQLSKPGCVEQTVQRSYELAFGLKSRQTSDNLALSPPQAVKFRDNQGVSRLEGFQSLLERFTPLSGDCAAHLFPEHGFTPS